MKRNRYSEEQVMYALKQVEWGDESVASICRKLGISEATFYNWRKKYAGMGVSEIRELRQLRDENVKLKRLVADLSLNKHMLQEVIAKKLWSLHVRESLLIGWKKSSKSAGVERVGYLVWIVLVITRQPV